MRQLLLFLLLSIIFASCSKQEEAIPKYSSYDLGMDGSRFVPDIGVLSATSTLAIGDTNVQQNPFTTAPVPLTGGGKFMYAVAQANSVMIGNESTSQIFASLPEETTIIQLLSDSSTIYVIHLNGKIDAFSMSGKSLWQTVARGFPSLNSILAGNALIFSSDSAINAIDIHSGKNMWVYHTALSVRSIIYDIKAKMIITALSFNSPEAADSILCFSLTGDLKSSSAFASTRILSNLCLCGKERDKIAFGYLSKPNLTGTRTMHIATYSGIQTGAPKLISEHALPYLPTNIASNRSMILSSGFLMNGGDLQSGIDAFYADDTTKLWQRRFSYPLVTPVSVSNKYAYFSLVFTTEAEIPTHSIFYTLEMSTGKTLGELPVLGAKNGFALGIPMPLQEKEFIMSDRNRSMLYFIRP